MINPAGSGRAARLARVAAGIFLFALFLAGAFARDPDGATHERIGKLRAEIARHDELYFRKNAPEISDEAYDRLKRELAALEAEVGSSDDENALIGDDREIAQTGVPHGARMLSLEKVYAEAELTAFFKKVRTQFPGRTLTWSIEPKYDGLAVSAVYENGKLVRVVTRGDGAAGEDVTATAHTIAGLPRTLAAQEMAPGETAGMPARIELRGEVFMTWAEFARLNRERAATGQPEFATPRNVAAGTLKLADPAEAAQRRLEIAFYGWGDVQPETARPRSQRAFHNWLRAQGLPGVAETRFTENETDALAAIRALGRRRGELPFPIDGVVVKLDDAAAREVLGETERAPRWAVVYKFSAAQAVTRVRSITLQIGRTGVLTPVAELDPVELAGATIVRATLHNRAELARRDVRVGDTVFLEKAGDIIPAITGVNRALRPPESAPFVFPQNCPACDALLVAEGAAERCPNDACPAQRAARLQHFASEGGVGLTGLGEATLAKLADAGKLRDLADFYRLSAEDLRAAGLDAAATRRALTAIEASKHATLDRWLVGLGVPRVGAGTAKKLAARFPTLTALASADEKTLAAVPGIGAKRAAGIVAFFARADTQTLLAALQAAGVEPTPPKPVAK